MTSAKYLRNTLISLRPELTISFVSNHDSQPLQLLEKPIAEWCNPLVYAIILLARAGIPCVFYPDLYGANIQTKGKDGNDHHIVLKKVTTCLHCFSPGNFLRMVNNEIISITKPRSGGQEKALEKKETADAQCC
jgi:hypothetical protein